MIDKNDLLNAIADEVAIVKNLYTMIPDGGLDYRPTPGQRSIRELLQYLTITLQAPMSLMEDGDFSRNETFREKAQSFDIEDFPAQMDQQLQVLRTELDGMTQEAFEQKPAYLPTGSEKTYEWAFLHIMLPWIAGYKMQLFLYIKQAGNTDIGTPECWMPPGGW